MHRQTFDGDAVAAAAAADAVAATARSKDLTLAALEQCLD